MDNLASEIKRKIRIRKFAMDNMGCDKNSDKSGIESFDSADNEIQKLCSQLYENIEEADQSKNQSGYSTIASKRKLGKAIVFIRKATRKIIYLLFGWYIKPILEKQTFFNGKTVNSINLMKQIVMLQEHNYTEKIKKLENRISSLEKSESITELDNITNELENKMNYVLGRLNVSCDINLLKQSDMDYFKFENNFRGSRNSIKEIQSVYVPYLKINGGGIVLDIGCGRGEFLELMMDNGIAASGVDSYEPFVHYCNERGFTVQLSDALTHLYALEDCSLGGIFMSQVVEHLSNDYINVLVTTAYKKLKPGCYFILETPNPDCLAAVSEFNIDMSHIKPVHYKALEFLFKEANYSSVERYHTEQSIYPVKAKHIEGSGINNLDDFNHGIDNINGLLFGHRDYTLIAKK